MGSRRPETQPICLWPQRPDAGSRVTAPRPAALPAALTLQPGVDGGTGLASPLREEVLVAGKGKGFSPSLRLGPLQNWPDPPVSPPTSCQPEPPRPLNRETPTATSVSVALGAEVFPLLTLYSCRGLSAILRFSRAQTAGRFCGSRADPRGPHGTLRSFRVAGCRALHLLRAGRRSRKRARLPARRAAGGSEKGKSRRTERWVLHLIQLRKFK